MTTMTTMTRFSVKVWEYGEDGYGTPAESVTVEAASEREARRLAARALGLKPYQWALENSPLWMDVSIEEG